MNLEYLDIIFNLLTRQTESVDDIISIMLDNTNHVQYMYAIISRVISIILKSNKLPYMRIDQLTCLLSNQLLFGRLGSLVVILILKVKTDINTIKIIIVENLKKMIRHIKKKENHYVIYIQLKTYCQVH